MAAQLSSAAAPSLPKRSFIFRAQQQAPPSIISSSTEGATHISLDCGYIYFLPKPSEEQPDDYGCPQCNAPKKHFARYDAQTGEAIGGTLLHIVVILSWVIGIAGVRALPVYGLLQDIHLATTIFAVH